ncbi:MAG: lipopolysaccharide transport periplasmic protein LptA [Deltaproteobacteria bacterium RIFOXYD12_FULL_50_9]|nr:MAG: lipopolysaccharide transport periplasmic protein LptA [Deltaproteobacteria bacterium RIFOXYD12_FULL_50_9]
MNLFNKLFLQFILPGFFLLLAGTTATAADQLNIKPKNAGLPVLIEADRMESEMGKDAVVVFSGRVEAKQGDLVMHSDQMRVFYATDDNNKNDIKTTPPQDQIAAPQKIQKLVATGNVEIIQENWIGTSDTLEYSEVERKVVLIGNAKVRQDNNIVVGETIVHYLDEGKSIVQRGSGQGQRVKALLFPNAPQNGDKADAPK